MKVRLTALLACGLAAGAGLAAPPPKPRMATDVPAGIAAPDKVQTRLGTLSFFDGFPDEATVEKVYDNLDFQRAVQAYLLALAPVNMAGLREGLLGVGRRLEFDDLSVGGHKISVEVSDSGELILGIDERRKVYLHELLVPVADG